MRREGERRENRERDEREDRQEGESREVGLERWAQEVSQRGFSEVCE